MTEYACAIAVVLVCVAGVVKVHCFFRFRNALSKILKEFTTSYGQRIDCSTASSEFVFECVVKDLRACVRLLPFASAQRLASDSFLGNLVFAGRDCADNSLIHMIEGVKDQVKSAALRRSGEMQKLRQRLVVPVTLVAGGFAFWSLLISSTDVLASQSTSRRSRVENLLFITQFEWEVGPDHVEARKWQAKSLGFWRSVISKRKVFAVEHGRTDMAENFGRIEIQLSILLQRLSGPVSSDTEAEVDLSDVKEQLIVLHSEISEMVFLEPLEGTPQYELGDVDSLVDEVIGMAAVPVTSFAQSLDQCQKTRYVALRLIPVLPEYVDKFGRSKVFELASVLDQLSKHTADASSYWDDPAERGKLSSFSRSIGRRAVILRSAMRGSWADVFNYMLESVPEKVAARLASAEA